ncbi:MAG: TRAP transporter fused permease subunit [Cryobacterium sp.]|nr:TRAP transporter fused permease subunit [Cryobacterium sp.]
MAFHLWTTWNGELPLFQHLAVVLAFAFSLVFIWNPIHKGEDGRRPVWALVVDGALWLAGLLTAGYLALNFQAIAFNPGIWSPVQIAVCVTAIILCIEGARRCIGWALPIFAIVALAYAFYRWNLGIFTHSPFTFEHVVTSVVFTRQGIFASPMAVIGTFLSVFMIFAAVLEISGIGRFFIDLARAAFGHRQGGAPKVALVASALHGSVSGAGVATTATTGSFTIPMMIKMGIDKQRAAAFEAAAGIGGAFLPPIMGAAAFIIASFLGVPYLAVIVAALVPALLYYWTLYWVIDIESKRLNLPREAKDSLPKIWNVLKTRGFQLIPIVVLVWALTAGSTPGRAGLYGVLAAFVVSFFYKETRLNLMRVLAVARSMAKMLVTLVMAVTCVGVVISVLSFTGLGLRLSGILLDMAGGSLLLLVILTAVASIILGAGLPATPVYLVLAVLVAPALIEFGVPPLAAHLFIFYFGVLGDMTPPLAISPMVAAGIAGSDPLKTTFTVMRVGLAGWLIPFWFVFHSGLILQGDIWTIATAIVGAVIGLFLLAVALQRHYRRSMNWFEVGLVAIGVFTLIFPNLWVNLIGVAIAAWVIVSQYRVKTDVEPRYLVAS